MLRKLLLVTVAVASLSAVSLAPTPASAWHGGWRVDGWRMGSWLGWRMGPRLARGMGARLGSWLGMASSGLGLGRTALCRGAWILRRRLCRSPSCPGPVGSALDLVNRCW